MSRAAALRTSRAVAPTMAVTRAIAVACFASAKQRDMLDLFAAADANAALNA